MWVSRRVWDLLFSELESLRREVSELREANRLLMQELLERAGSTKTITGPPTELPSCIERGDGTLRYSDGRVTTKTGQPITDDPTVLEKVREVEEGFNMSKLPKPPGTVGA